MSEFSELSLAAYKAIIADDVEAFVALADPEVDFNSLIENRSYHGHEGVREWWAGVINALGGVTLDLEEVKDYGDKGYVKLVATSTGGDVEVPQALWQAMRLENGKAVWWGIFANEAEAREALGVSEED